MKTKFGSIVIDGRGKIGGHVASKNRSGNYLRTKVTPVNPRTTFQQNVRNTFGSLSQAWRGLTEDQRASWNNAVAAYAKTDIFGDLRNPSGISLFQKLNNVIINIDQVMLRTAPAPEAVKFLQLNDAVVTAGIDTCSISINPVMILGDVVIVKATPPLSAGKSFVKNAFRQISVLLDVNANPIDVSAAYIAKFGTGAVEGQKIVFQIVSVNINTGHVSVPSEFAAIVGA